MTVAVIDLHGIAVAALRAGKDHTAACCGKNRRTARCDEIDARVKTELMRKRIDTVAERRAEAGAIGWHPARKRAERDLVHIRLVFERGERRTHAIELLLGRSRVAARRPRGDFDAAPRRQRRSALAVRIRSVLIG